LIGDDVGSRVKGGEVVLNLPAQSAVAFKAF